MDLHAFSVSRSDMRREDGCIIEAGRKGLHLSSEGLNFLRVGGGLSMHDILLGPLTPFYHRSFTVLL